MNFRLFLNEATKEDFWNLAQQQRDIPEKAMLKVQRAMSGGVMNSVAEHVGDIIHRMSEKNTFAWAGYDYVKEKVKKCLMWLENPYGFEKEFKENIRNNARYYKMDETEFANKIYAALKEYGEEHAKLPTYNNAQRLAQMSAVSLGRLDFNATIYALRQLDKRLGSQEEWIKFAHEGLNP